jgi:rubrerythrin
MAEFANPFSGMVPARKMTREELVRALRLDLAAEEEAVHLYTAHASATDEPLAKKVLQDIANEEIVHAGEFKHLIEILEPQERKLLGQGRDEVEQLARQLAAIKEA